MAPTVHSIIFAMAGGFIVGLLYGHGSSAGSNTVRPIAVRESATTQLLHTRSSTLPPLPAALPPPPPMATSSSSSSAAAADPFLLIGVISAPNSFGRRAMLRSFAEASAGPSSRRVATEFVFGDRFYEGSPSIETNRRLAAESHEYGDVVFVDAREKLPHVGKATEKSAAWWLTAPKRSNANFFCKTDDDSLLHHEHLTAALAAAAASAAPHSPHILFSYVRWRGWLPNNRFQACGGGWGGPIDCIRHMLDPKEQCELAEGPFPQGTGQLTCMSRELAQKLAASPEFDTFYRVSMARNDYGQKCITAQECSTHAPGLHMWHHEDAGISYNAWKASGHPRPRTAHALPRTHARVRPPSSLSHDLRSSTPATPRPLARSPARLLASSRRPHSPTTSR